MKDDKTLTIVIPSYNVSKYLPEILPTYFVPAILKDLEILIVNDGSKDNTADIAETFAEKYPDTITVINKENGGHGSTINTGINNAHGKYFKVIDGDDWVDSANLAEFISKLKLYDADIVLNSFTRVMEGTGEKEVKRIQGLKQGFVYPFLDILPVIRDSYAMHGTTFLTEQFKKAEKIDEHCFYVDLEYLLYPIPYLRSAIYFDIPVYQYRVGSSEQSMSLKNMQKNRSMHERVIFSLLGMLPLKNSCDSHLEEFILYRIEKMCQLQIDILFSLEDRATAKKELTEFFTKIKTKNEKVYRNIPGKKAKILRKFGMKSFDLIRILKTGK